MPYLYKERLCRLANKIKHKKSRLSSSSSSSSNSPSTTPETSPSTSNQTMQDKGTTTKDRKRDRVKKILKKTAKVIGLLIYCPLRLIDLIAGIILTLAFLPITALIAFINWVISGEI